MSGFDKEWLQELKAMKAEIARLKLKIDYLETDNRTLRADRDYYKQLVDQTGGKG